MNLKNGYKVIYDKAANGQRTFYASKTGRFSDAEVISTATIGEYKLIYEKNGKFYGSLTGIPTETDHCFEEFRVVFEDGYIKSDTISIPDTDPDITNAENENKNQDEPDPESV